MADPNIFVPTPNTLTAIPVASRTAAQKVDLAHLRHLIGLLRVQRTMLRNQVALAKFILLLDGSRARSEDVSEVEPE